MAKKKSVSIDNVQAIKRIDFDLPDDAGGVILFTGHNAAGKTTALACLEALASGGGRPLRPRDGAAKGEVEGLGVTRTIGKTSRNKGEIEVDELSSRLNLSELVEPTAIDPVVRNKNRIKALVALSGSWATEEDFHETFGGKEIYESVVDPAAIMAGMDALEMAQRIKRQAEAGAREAEADLAQLLAEHSALTAAAVGAPNKEPPSTAALADAYAAAKTARQNGVAQNERREAAVAANQRVLTAQLQHAEKTPVSGLEELEADVELWDERAAELETRLAEARRRSSEAQATLRTAKTWHEEKERLEGLLQEAEEEVPQAKMDELAKIDMEAFEALQNGETQRTKWSARLKAAALEEQIQKAELRAGQLRHAALKTMDVLQTKIPKGSIRVRDGVLCVMHEGREKAVPYDELSTGERWGEAIKLAAKQLEPGGIIFASQEAWQSLDTVRKAEVVAHCEAAKVWLASGEIMDGPLEVKLVRGKQLAGGIN